MIYFTPIEEPVAEMNFHIPAAALVTLRLTLESCFSAPAVLQPKLGNWHDENGNTIFIPSQVQPKYNYVAPAAKHTVSVSFQLPQDITAGTVLRTQLHFSGFKNCTLPVQVTLTEKDPEHSLFLEEHQLTLPLSGSVRMNASKESRRAAGNVFFTESILKLISGMDALEKIPSRWIVTEMLLTVADNGRQLAVKEEMQQLIYKLQRTIFYKNGSLVTAGSQLLHWLSTGHGIASNLQTLSSKEPGEQQRMIHSWEKWMLNLLGEDIEHAAAVNPEVHFEPPQPFEVLLKAIDGKPEKLFLFFILGVMEISPRLKAVILQVTGNIAVQENPVAADEANPPADVLSEEGSLQR